MNKPLFSLIITLALIPTAQAEFTIYEADGNVVKLKGWADVRTVNTQGETELVDGTSRLNINFARDMGDGFTVIATMETGVNLVGQTSIGFAGGDSFQTRRDDLLNLRLGYVGVTHEKWGQLTLGKQWGVYYDLAGITDWGHTWASMAAGVYNFNGDGGLSGTGRAEKAVQYRKQWGDLSLAVQTQLQGTSDAIDAFDLPSNPGAQILEVGYDSTVGATVSYRFAEDHFVAASFNEGTFTALLEFGSSIERDDRIVALGYQYGEYADGIFFAAMFNDAEYHELDNLNRIIPESTGFEMFASYRRDNSRFMPYVLYNSLDAGDFYETLYSGDKFHREFVALGAVYFWNEQTELYLDVRIDSSSMSAAQAEFEDDGAAIGMRFSF